MEDLVRSLDCSRAVHPNDVGRLPRLPGLYAIWDDHDQLVYVGQSKNSVRDRVHDYLRCARPNETLYILLVDHRLRPNMSADNRNIAQIAVGYLLNCRFAGWAWDGTQTLPELERQVIDAGLRGQRPLNSPSRMRVVSMPEPDVCAKCGSEMEIDDQVLLGPNGMYEHINCSRCD